MYCLNCINELSSCFVFNSKSLYILFLLISVSIAEILPGSNGIGYDYPKPNVPFETGVIKKLADIPKPTYLPPTESTTKPTTTSPKVAVAKKDDNDGYKYPAPEVRLDLPTKPAPAIAKKVVDTPKPTYLPPVTTTKPTVTIAKKTPPTPKPIPTTTSPKVAVAKKDDNDGYKYPAPEVRLDLPTKPAPAIAKKVVDTPKPTYLPPVTTTKPTVTTAKKTPPTPKPIPTTTSPKVAVAKKDDNDGYKYPAPEVRLDLPTRPTPAIAKKVVDTPKPTYLPPVTTTKPTVTTAKKTPPTPKPTYLPPVTTAKPITTTTSPKVAVAKKDDNDGYKYPAPEVRLDLPTKPTPAIAKKVVDTPKPTYLPPVTTTKPTVTTAKKTPPTPKPIPTTSPKIAVAKKDDNEGYKYPAPEVRLDLPTKPTPAIAKKVVDTPKPTYLPPVTTTKPTVTTAKTTPPTPKPIPTTSPKIAVAKKDDNEGYKYPAPEVRLDLPTKPTPAIAKKVVDTPKPTYLPPVTTTKTTVTTAKKTPPTPKPTYLPPVTNAKPIPTTTTSPKVDVAEKDDNDGYKYPVPEVRLDLPTKPTPAIAKKVVDTPKPTYLPPVTTTKTTVTTAKKTPPTPKPTYLPPVTTAKPIPTTTSPKVAVTKKDDNDGYKYPVPEVRLDLPTKPTPAIAKKVVDTPKPTYLPPVTTTKTTVTTAKKTPPTPKPTYLPPVTTAKPIPTTTSPKVAVTKKDDNDGYKYPVPEVRLDLPTKPAPAIEKKVVDTPKPTYLPPVTTTKPTVTTAKKTPPTPKPIPTTTSPKIAVAKKDDNDGYKYPAPEVRLRLPTVF